MFLRANLFLTCQMSYHLLPQAAPFFDKLVFSKVKQRLGGNVKLIVSGGAPLAPHVEEFLKVAMCAPVVQVRHVKASSVVYYKLFCGACASCVCTPNTIACCSLACAEVADKYCQVSAKCLHLTSCVFPAACHPNAGLRPDRDVRRQLHRCA